MSRTRKGSKQLGYDYWSKRPYSGCGYGSHIKDMCHRAESMQERELIYRETSKAWSEYLDSFTDDGETYYYKYVDEDGEEYETVDVGEYVTLKGFEVIK